MPSNSNLTSDELNQKMIEAIEAGRTTFTMWQEEDGNWRGKSIKDDKTVQYRDVGPETLLKYLLTNDGN